MNDASPAPSLPSRRGVLLTGLGLAGAAALWGSGTASAEAAGAPGATADQWSGTTTANGWQVAADDDVTRTRIEGSDASVTLRNGDAATVLAYVARRYHYEIHTLAAGDVTGHTLSRRVTAAYQSNYLSGTALAIRPELYPAGVEGGFFPNELVVLRDILADCEGVVRWGGDERREPKESHFQIDVEPGDATLREVAAKLEGWARTPGRGAGAIDPFAPARRRAAQALQRRQAA